MNGESVEDAKRLAPMTKEEWDKQESVIRRVYDEDTGRSAYGSLGQYVK